ncbi:MAG: glycosyltransferase family 2 protein, partial [Hungatella sp.]
RRYIEYLPRIEASYLHCLEIGEIPEHGGVLGTGSFKAAYNLGAWYEATGDLKKADNYYQLSKNMRNE